MESAETVKRRMSAKEKTIAEISSNDIRVKIFGAVIEKTESSLTVDDGSGKIEIFFDALPEIETGEKTRIIARILPLTEGFEARGEVLQDMEGFDFDLYRKAKEIFKQEQIYKG